MNYKITSLLILLSLSSLLSTCPTNLNICNNAVTSGFLYDNLYAKIRSTASSACLTCSGLGDCNNDICTCRQPNSGIFYGLTMVSGEDCSTVRELVELTTFDYYLYNAFAAFLFIMGIFCSIIIYTYKSSSYIHEISSVGQLTSIGTIFAAGAICVISLSLRQDWQCQLSWWLLSMTYNFLFGSILARTFKVYLSAEKWDVTTKFLLMILAIFVVIDLFLLAAITYFFPYSIVGFETINENNVYLVCQSSTDVLLYIIGGIKAFLTVWAMFLVLKIVWSHDKIHLVEITQLGLVVYNVAILCAALFAVFRYYSSSKPYIIIWLRGICLFYASLFTLLVLYTQRFYNAIFSPSKPNTSHGYPSSDRTRSKESSENNLSTDNADELPKIPMVNSPNRSPSNRGNDKSASKTLNFERYHTHSGLEMSKMDTRLQQYDNSMTIKSNNAVMQGHRDDSISVKSNINLPRGQYNNPQSNPQGLYNFFPNDSTSPLPSPRSQGDVYLTSYTGVSTTGKSMKMTKVNRYASASPEPASPVSPRSFNYSYNTYNQQFQPNAAGANNLYANNNQQPISANSMKIYNQNNSVLNPLSDRSLNDTQNISFNNSNQSILGLKDNRSDYVTPDRPNKDNLIGTLLSPDEAEIIRLRRENLQLRSNYEYVTRENQEVIKQQDAILNHYQDIVYKAPSIVSSASVGNPNTTSQNEIRIIKQNIASMKGGRSIKPADKR